MLNPKGRRSPLRQARGAAANVLLILASAAFLAACGGGGASGRAPDFPLVSAQKGRVVLLNFWAPWCDSCKAEMPTVEAIRRAHAGDRFALVPVDVDTADRRFLEAYAVRELPTTFLIAADGTIARRYVGPLDRGTVENDIVTLLNK